MQFSLSGRASPRKRGVAPIMKRYLLFILASTIAACSIIDDDLSVCGVDYEISYEVRLVTDIDIVIENKLSSVADLPTANALRTWLEPTFSGFAHDLDMLFYSWGEDDLRHSWHEIVDARSASYTLYIPREDYMHLAVVNTEDNPNVRMDGMNHAASLAIHQEKSDTLPTYNTAIYSARMPITMSDSTILSYNVHLYMVTCAVALIVESDSVPATDMRVFLSGTASDFDIRDSLYTFAYSSLIRMDELSSRCYAVTAMPSPDAPAASMPALMQAQKNAKSLWQLRAYTPLNNGTITETILDIDSPLRAGTLEIIRVKQLPDGSLEPVENSNVGVSVTLDWKDGGTHAIEL